MFLNELNYIIYSINNEYNFNCQSVRSTKRVISYTSKEDVNVYYNCRVSDNGENFVNSSQDTSVYFYVTSTLIIIIIELKLFALPYLIDMTLN